MNAIGNVCCIAFFVIVACQGILLHWHYSRHSNWRWLNKRYPAPSIETSERSLAFSGVTIRVNQHWYCRVLHVVLNSAGMQCTMRAPLLRLFHRPLLIPWDDVTLRDVTADGSVMLDVGEFTTLTLTGKAALAIHRMMERLAPVAPERHSAPSHQGERTCQIRGSRLTQAQARDLNRRQRS